MKRIAVLVVVTAVLVGVLVAEESGSTPGRRGAQGGRRGTPAGMQPGQGGPGFMREGFAEWYDELSKAYEQNNKEKMGELIAQMKPRMERMRAFMGRPGGGPPESIGPGDRAMRGGPGRFGQGGEGTSLDSAPLPKTDGEKKILSILDDMNSSQGRRMMNVPPSDGRLLRLLTEATGAKHVVEVGTSNGYSGIWFCLGLQKTGGKLTTHEIDANRASLARENFKRAGVDKIVTLVEGDAHQEVTKIKEPIDILFLDADKDGYIDYLNKLLGLVRPGGLIVGHNISARQSDPRYIKAITTNPDLETIMYQQGGGVSVTLKKR